MNIFLSGTSSAGKSSIIKEMPKKYNIVSLDGLYEKYNFEICTNNNLKNKYYSKKEKDRIHSDCLYKKLIECLKKENIIDWVDTFNDKYELLIDKYLPNRFHILIYTNIYDLVNNINKRKLYEPRGVWLFEEQFVKYYIKTNNKNEAIDTINYNKFIKSLERIKYEFESKKDLNKFAEKIFNLLGIKKIIKDKDYYIKTRLDNYNLILITKNKSPSELKDIILKTIK
tara:strand:- start:10 stop:690 length:681 start_codon:yes stop_codon:yes gene_type:complete